MINRLVQRSQFAVYCIVISSFFSPCANAMNFNTAWQKTLEKSDSLAADRDNIAISEALRDAATDLYLPKVDLIASYTHMQKPIALDVKALEPFRSLDPAALSAELAALIGPLLTTNPTVTNFTEQNVTNSLITAIWTLYTGGSRGAAIDIAKERASEASMLLAMKQQSKFEDLARVYFGVSLAAQLVKTYQEVERGLYQHQQNAIKLEEQGQIARVQRLKADAAYDKAKVDTQKAIHQYEIAQLALSSFLHVNEPVIPSTDLFVRQNLHEQSYYLDKTMGSYPGLDILDSKRKQAQKKVTIAKSNYLPKVFMYGTHNVYEDDSLVSQASPDWLVGVGVSVPIFDNTGRAGKLSAARTSVSKVSHLKAQAYRDLKLLVEQTFREAEQAKQEYNGLASSQELAEETLKLNQKAFSQGLATSVDVVDAEMFQASVKTQRLSAAYQHVLALAKLSALSGDMANFLHSNQIQ